MVGIITRGKKVVLNTGPRMASEVMLMRMKMRRKKKKRMVKF